MMTSFSLDTERAGVASNLSAAQNEKTVSTFLLLLLLLPDPPVSGGCTSSSPRRVPDSGSSPRRLRLRRSFPPPLPGPLFSSAAERILCDYSADDRVRNPAAASQIPASPAN